VRGHTFLICERASELKRELWVEEERVDLGEVEQQSRRQFQELVAARRR
jgi:hypothetical protein